MRSRILPVEEWSRLDFNCFSQTGRTMHPENVQVAVVEDGERILATMGVLRVTHFEDLWKDPSVSVNAGMTRRLLKEGISAAKRWDAKWIWASTETDTGVRMISRIGGVAIPVRSFIIPLGETT